MKQAYARSFLLTLPALLLGLVTAQAQTGGSVGIGTAAPDPKAALDIRSTDKGLLIPRLDSAQRAGISAPPDGLMVFQTNGRKGFWYAIGGQWVYIPDKTKSGDNLGNHTATQNLSLNDNELRLRAGSDGSHGLGWYGVSNSSKNWLSQNIDGPVLYGYDGGVLGTNNGTRQSTLFWNSQGRVGIGTTTPNARLDLGQGALMLGAAIGNNVARPAVGTARLAGEISAYGLAGGTAPVATADDGYLRLSAGGGTSAATKSFIDLAGYSTVADVNQTIRLGTAGTERLRVLAGGNVGIGRTDPQQQLHVAGNIAADGPLGVVLAAANRPLITRSWDAFTSGIYQGLGRWGVFMEPNALTFGVPNIANKRFQWVRYADNSTVASTLMTLTQDGNLQLAGSYGYSAAQTRTYTVGPGAFVSADPSTSQAGTLYGNSNGPIPVGVTLTGSGTGSLLAPLELPVGAVIINLELTVYDGDNSTAVTTQGRIVGVAGNVGTNFADTPSTSWVTVPHGNSVVVQGSGPVSMTTDANHAYFVEYQANRSGLLGLMTVRVTYTVTKAD
jgi:hypothetical protein